MSEGYGEIFLSHSSSDKEFVEEIYNRLDVSNTFYDIKSVYPGQSFLDAMKSANSTKNVFVLFHSPNTVNTWVEYERDLAEINKASRRGRVLIVPIGGENYHSLPDWMQEFMTCTEEFSVSDIVRQILFLQNEIISEVSHERHVFIGREELCRQFHLKSVKNLQATGAPLQHVVIAGLPGMGRTSVASEFTRKTFHSMRPAGPVFDLPDMAEAIDFYLALLQDIKGAMSKEELERQIDCFQGMEEEQQAQFVYGLFKHWALINQPVVVKTRKGLRDRSRNMKPWFSHFLEISKSTPSLRVIYISDRRLPDESALNFENLAQFHVGELSDSDIQYLLGELIEARYYDSGKSEALSRHIHGHPATAHYAAKLINTGKNLDTLNENPEPIFAFQERVLGIILSSEMLSNVQKKIIALLGIFPILSFGIMSRVVNVPRKELSEEIWDLQESSLIAAAGAEYFSSPGIVTYRSRKELYKFGMELFQEVKRIIEEDMSQGKLDAQLIDALLLASLEEAGKIPDELFELVTSSSLLSMVTSRFSRAREMPKGAKEVFLSAYNLSKLALKMKASDDSLEHILFTGGDSAIRAGVYPSDIIEKMRNSSFSSVYYLEGSYAFYVKKDNNEAVVNLNKSFQMKHFKLRNARLLSRAYIRMQRFSDALEVINSLPDWQIERETGLIVQKIRALRGMRSHKEASELEKKILGRDDEYGEIYIYNAGKAIREGRFDDALGFLKKAETSPKANQFSLQLLKCAILIEQGDASLLPFVVETANSVNRKYDALQLQARHAVVRGQWRDAEKFLSKIDKKDFFDLQIELRMLKQKIEDKDIKIDVLSYAECQKRIENVSRLSTSSLEGYRDA
ncbi:toll/interleukin-1 receptor domain-containing protein [Thalassospira sp. NFXS8]|uniref:toll/interleukin-1 receptor domain-containing protein n=1 Tax=Thalassospira sp. NFXS8 TaxID=2819093 RepID=UPI0032DFB5F5